MKIEKILVAELEMEGGAKITGEAASNEALLETIIDRFNLFEPEITQTKGALNTAEKVARLLSGAKVDFGVTKSGMPGIWATIGEGEKQWIASYDPDNDGGQNLHYSEPYGGWKTVYSQGYDPYGYKSYLFPHLTKAAKKVADRWVMFLCDKYEAIMNADPMPESFEITLS